MADYNPIRSVNGKAVKCPSGYKYSLNDISASDAGRTEDTNMDKKRIGQCVKLEMEWQNVSIEDAAAIIQAWDSCRTVLRLLSSSITSCISMP